MRFRFETYEKACFRALLLLVLSASPSWAAGLTAVDAGRAACRSTRRMSRSARSSRSGRASAKRSIVNVERITGGPITLKLDDVPEKQALDIILRTIPGYMALPRATLCRRRVALRSHSDHGDDDRRCGASAAAAGAQDSPACKAASQAAAERHAAAAHARRRSRPGMLPEPDDPADQMDDPAIAAAAAAGLVPVPALTPGPAGCSGTADAARRRSTAAAGASRAGTSRSPTNPWNVPVGTAQPSLAPPPPAAAAADRSRSRAASAAARSISRPSRYNSADALAATTSTLTQCQKSIGTGRRTSAA